MKSKTRKTVKDFGELARAKVERALMRTLAPGRFKPRVLGEAMRHAVLAGGKRIRPTLALAAAVAVGGRADDALSPALAIEILHNYTLVHDDLPAMDNDKLRRGRPTVWAKFGEANAILAGDALLALAFGLAAKVPRNAEAVVAELAASGVGVVCGQVADLRRGKGADIGFIYRHKTADLFVAAAAMGALAGGGSARAVAAVKRYALNLGLAFQYEDDLLDGDSPYSRKRTEALIAATTRRAQAALKDLPGDTEFLQALADRLAVRRA